MERSKLSADLLKLQVRALATQAFAGGGCEARRVTVAQVQKENFDSEMKGRASEIAAKDR